MAEDRPAETTITERVEELLAAMTLAEKAGQLTQYFAFGEEATVPPEMQGPNEVSDALARGGGGID